MLDIISSVTLPDMQAVPIFLSTVKPLTASHGASTERSSIFIACILLALMSVVFHILSEPESPQELLTCIGKTTVGREIIGLWKKFWEWGSLAWIIFGVLFPVGSGVAAVEGMYFVARCFVAVGCILSVLKVIDVVRTEDRPKKSKTEIVWASAIIVVLGLLAAWGCFSFIDVIQRNHEMVIKMAFKQSPVLTERRQDHIQWELNNYFLYLKKAGFDLPIDIPPLGTAPQNGLMIIGGPLQGPISTVSLLIPEDAIKNDDNLRFAYSIYIFNRMLVAPVMYMPAPNRVEKENDEVAAWILECYFSSSFVGRRVCDKETPGYQWQDALWEVREQFGQDYTDGLMSYTATLWASVPSKDVDNFDKFFRYKLASGESVKGNSNIDIVFKRHKLDP